MRRFIYLTCMIIACLPSRLADAHGTPIVVNSIGGGLSVSGGVSDNEGFAARLFFEDDEEGDPLPPAVLPNVGPVLIWQIPGYEISGLNNQSSLSIEVLARPVKDSNPLEQRVLWYWNPSGTVEPAASALHLLGTGMRHTTLSPSDDTAPPPFLMTSNLQGQQGFHNHGLLSYALDNDPEPADGAYGFFARLISNQYGPSNPFLIVLNHGVDHEQMIDAALAINAAAVEPSSQPGDFNLDGVVDAADYVVWRKAINEPLEFERWQANFGASLPGGGGRSAAFTSVPELPAFSLLGIMTAAVHAAACLRTQNGRQPRYNASTAISADFKIGRFD